MHSYAASPKSRVLPLLAILPIVLVVAACNDELSTEPRRAAMTPAKPSASLLTAEIHTIYHNNAHQSITQVPMGTTVHASTFLTYTGLTPTGTVTFHWYGGGSCDANPMISQPTMALDAFAEAHITTFSLNAELVYGLRVEYSGDANYAKSYGPCIVLNASGKLLPSIAMELHSFFEDVLDEVPAGSNVHPKAVVTGPNGTPSGIATFRLYYGGSCTGTPFFAPPTAVLLDASGAAHGLVAMMGPVEGTWAYQATYYGDDFYALITGPCKVFTTVAKQATTATLELHDASHQITTTFPVATVLHGKLTFTGSPAPSGEVSLRRFTNASCQGSWVSSTTTQMSNGSIDPLGGMVAMSVGTMSFNASYDGNDTYANATSNCITVTVVENRMTPTVTSEVHNASHQSITTLGTSGSAHAKGIISGSGPTPTGHLVFDWYPNATCDGVGFTSSLGALDATGATDVSWSTFTGGIVGETYSMRVRYLGDQSYTSALGPCMPYSIVAEMIALKLGSIGYWKNWSNHYSPQQLQQLIDAVKTSYAPVFNRDGVAGNADDLTAAKTDAIYLSKKPTTAQQVLAHYTSLAFDLALTQMAQQAGLDKPNDSICGAAVLDVSSISGAAALLGTSSPTLAQVMTFVTQRWNGTLTASKVNPSFNLTQGELDVVFQVLSKVNNGTIVVSAGC